MISLSGSADYKVKQCQCVHDPCAVLRRAMILVPLKFFHMVIAIHYYLSKIRHKFLLNFFVKNRVSKIITVDSTKDILSSQLLVYYLKSGEGLKQIILIISTNHRFNLLHADVIIIEYVEGAFLCCTITHMKTIE